MRNISVFNFSFVILVTILFTTCCGSTKNMSLDKRMNLWSLETGPISGGHFYCADVGDFNGDTIPDIAAGSFDPGGIMVWLGKGDGSWVPISSPSEEGEIQSISVADINNDGFSDIISSSAGSLQGITLWYSKGDGGWEKANGIDDDAGYQEIKIADVNNDDWKDIIVANNSLGLSGGVRVWLNQGDGTLSPQLGPERAGRFKKIEVADLNKDGNIDIVASSIGMTGGIKLWYGDGKGNWSPSIDLDIKSYILGLCTGDVDQDGWTDIVASVYFQGICIFYNNKAGIFSEAKRVTKKGSFWDILLLDWNKDGSKDILGSSIESEGILVWLNHGKTNWKFIDTGLPRNQTYYGLNKTDLNLDNLTDLLAASYSEGIHVWLQTADSRPVTTQEKEVIFKAPKEEIKKKEEFHLVTQNGAFTTAMGIPEYRIAAMDKLIIKIWVGNEENEYNATVNAKGEIYLPFMSFGSLKVGDLSSLQIKEIIEDKLKNFIKRPSVEVEVEEYIGRKVTLTGEIRGLSRAETGPGTYPLKGKITAMEYISTHGGVTAKGNLSQVRLIRKGRVYTYNLFKAITQADVKENPILDEDDMIYIPSLAEADKRLLVLGEVKKPGVVSYTDDISLLDAISRAGSFTNDAVLDKVFVVRGDINKPEVVEANLGNIIRKGDLTQNIVLQSGDIIYVPRRFLAKVGDFLRVIHPSLLSIQSIYILHRFASED